MQWYERSRYDYTHKCLSIPAARDMNFYQVDIECFDYEVIHSSKIIIYL